MTSGRAIGARRARSALAAFLGVWLLVACGTAATLTSAPAPTMPRTHSSTSGSGPGAGPTGPTQAAHVTRITDGDTIHVDISGIDYRLRYIGMDTPESVKPDTPVQPYAKAAAARNAALVAGRDVILEKDVSETDSYGRLLRYVWIHDGGTWTMANMELVRTGYAHVLTYPPDVKYASLFVDAERTARDAGLGLWAAGPTP